MVVVCNLIFLEVVDVKSAKVSAFLTYSLPSILSAPTLVFFPKIGFGVFFLGVTRALTVLTATFLSLYSTPRKHENPRKP